MAATRMQRRVLAGALVAVSCVSLLAGTVGIWANRNLLDTEVWSDRAEVLLDEPDVRDALARRITDAAMTRVDPEALFEQALPGRGQILALPLAAAVEAFVRDQVDRVLAGDAFARLWVEANRTAHERAVRVLRGDSDVVVADEDAVTIDLRPAVARVLERVAELAPELVTQRVELPPDAGRITVYDSGTLREIQRAVALFDRLVWVSVALFVASTVGALVVSPRRRRTALHLIAVDVVALIVVRRAAGRIEAHVLDLVSGDDRAAAQAATSTLLSGLFDGTRMLLWLLAIAAVLVVASGRASVRTVRGHDADET